MLCKLCHRIAKVSQLCVIYYLIALLDPGQANLTRSVSGSQDWRRANLPYQDVVLM